MKLERLSIIFVFIFFQLKVSVDSNLYTRDNDMFTCPTKNQPTIEYYYLDEDQFIFMSSRVIWQEAYDICRAHRANLASVDTNIKAHVLSRAMAYSNIEMEDIWVGGYRLPNGTWLWVHGATISIKPENGYPPWVRIPNRPFKGCLAMDRLKHNLPLFIDLECRLPKPFMCQKSIFEPINPDIIMPSNIVIVGIKMYLIYFKKLKWIEAEALCREKGYKLAELTNMNETKALIKGMAVSRPSFESVWLSGQYSDGKWRWLSTGKAFPGFPNSKTNFPPWNSRYVNATRGCTILDRHFNTPEFLPVRCESKKDFVCERYARKNMEISEKFNTDEVVPLVYENWNMLLFSKKLSWNDAKQQCFKFNAKLTEIENEEMMEKILSAMADYSYEMHHLWLGGKLVNDSWTWADSHRGVAVHPNSDLIQWDSEDNDTKSSCLNVDRRLYNKALFYGLDCQIQQPFICTILPPTTKKPSKEVTEKITRVFVPVTSPTTERTTTTEINVISSKPEEINDCPFEPISVSYLGRTYVAFYSKVSYEDSFNKCKEAGGELTDLPTKFFKPLSEKLPKSCKEYWISNTKLSCSHLDVNDQDIHLANDCLEEKPFICSIVCSYPPTNQIYLDTLWTCNKTGTNSFQCSIKCHQHTVLKGVSILTCRNRGWINNYNRTTFLPICIRIKMIAKDLSRTINRVVNEGYGMLFMLDESYTVNTTEWWIQVQFVASIIQVVPISSKIPMGLITFSNKPVVRIPYNATDTCEVLETLQKLSPTPNREFLFFQSAFEEAQRQINQLQPGRRTIIFFVTSGENKGGEYRLTINELKKNNFIITIGISDEGMDHLVEMASIIRDRVPMYKFNDYNSLQYVALGITKFRARRLRCPPRYYILPSDTICHDKPISFRFKNRSFSAFFDPTEFTQAKDLCLEFGGQLAQIDERDFVPISNQIKTLVPDCVDPALWVDKRGECCALSAENKKFACSVLLGRICDIDCNKLPTGPNYENNFWECETGDNEKVCDVSCKEDNTLIGSESVTCTPLGLTTGGNATVSFPQCLNSLKTSMSMVASTKYLTNEYDGMLFVVDESYTVDNLEWFKQLQFVVSMLQVFPPSRFFMFGLILFSQTPRIAIPLKGINTCKALTIIQQLKPRPDRQFTYYREALEAVKSQTASIPEGRKTIVYFIASNDNGGADFIDFANTLKEKHFFITIAIGSTVSSDASALASTELDKVYNYRFTDTQSFFVFSKYLMYNRSSSVQCDIHLYSVPISSDDVTKSN